MQTASGSTPHWPESGIGYSRQAWIRFTPPANKLSGEDPDGAPALKRHPGMTQLSWAGDVAVVDAPASLDSSGVGDV